MAAGRPTDYDPEYHPKALIEFMSDPHGLSFASACAKMGVMTRTAYVWVEKHEEFLHAKEVGTQNNLLFFEEVGNQAMMGEIPMFRDPLWKYNMANRHKWTDKPKEDAQQLEIKIFIDSEDASL